MLSVLEKIDPNTWAGLFGLLLTLSLWTYHRIRGDNQDRWGDVFTGIGKQALTILAKDPSFTVEDLQKKAEDLVWDLASKAHVPVPRNSTTEAIANPIIAHLVGDTLTKLRS